VPKKSFPIKYDVFDSSSMSTILISFNEYEGNLIRKKSFQFFIEFSKSKYSYNSKSDNFNNSSNFSLFIFSILLFSFLLILLF
jgi:hypothetical protein